MFVTSADASHNGVYMCVVSVLEEGGSVVERSSRNATVTVFTCELYNECIASSSSFHYSW